MRHFGNSSGKFAMWGLGTLVAQVAAPMFFAASIAAYIIVTKLSAFSCNLLPRREARRAKLEPRAGYRTRRSA